MLSSDLRRRAVSLRADRCRTSVMLLCLALVGSGATLAAQARPGSSTAPRGGTSASAAALARAGDAVVTIVAYREGTSGVISGTGVRLTDGRIVTSLRHLRGASRAEIFGAEGDLLATATTLEQADVKLDLGVFARVTIPGENLVLARRSAVVATKVNLLGPRKATVRPVAERTITAVEADSVRPLLRLGALVTATAAGSPVVNARNELVGIAMGTVPGRDDVDLAVDVAAVRDLLARPTTLFAFPTRDGTVAPAKGAADPKAVASGGPAANGGARPRAANVFPERYGAPVAADTARAWAVELYGCARLESRQKVYCYLRITNLQRGATFAINGADLADSTRRKLREAENLYVGETVQRVAGWRTKAEVTLRELESTRVALEFSPPAKDGDPIRLMVDVAGERALWFGPVALQRAP